MLFGFKVALKPSVNIGAIAQVNTRSLKWGAYFLPEFHFIAGLGVTSGTRRGNYKELCQNRGFPLRSPCAESRPYAQHLFYRVFNPP
ncbi:hypothetical protein KCP69_19480 [Salmonella enterica subsp. enterica]|nr:hypothetical protein KCP69_19480 [Salmonella enterica subsp. enterica]